MPFPVQQGHASIAELLDPDLAIALARIDDRVDRQFFLLSWFFRHFCDDLPDGAFLRYEDMVASNGAALAAVVVPCRRPIRPLRPVRARSRPELGALGRRLL